MDIKLISVSEEHWGNDFPKRMPDLARRLLRPKEEKEYNFTGEKRALCVPGMTLVFRFDGFLLGEGVVNRVENDGWRVIYTPTRIYRPSVKSSQFFNSGANAYYELAPAQLKKIRGGVAEESSDRNLKTGENPGTTTHRIGQGAVREAALTRYRNRCCLCDIDDPRLLVAGHIKGWAKGEKERGQPENVVLMCLLHDGLFGKGLMTLSPRTYAPKFAEKALSVRTLKLVRKLTQDFNEPKNSSPSSKFLRWHREKVFRRND